MERVNEYELPFRKGDSGPKYFFRGDRLEWGIIVLKPGEKMGQHGHNEVEEMFYFVEGEPTILINDEPYQVRQGDAFRVSPKEKHDIHNNTNSNVKIVFIKCPYIPEDKITYE